MPILDLNDKDAVNSFYFTRGDRFLLLGNNVLHKSNLMGKENILIISMYSYDLVLPAYTEYHENGSLRTHLFVVLTKTKGIRSYVATFSSLFSKKTTKLPDKSNRKVAKRLALKLHCYSHLTVDNMETICKRANVLRNK